MAGDWGDLLLRFPDQPATVLKRLRGLSASAGTYNIGGLLKVDICQEGIRAGISDIFVPFIFVPWKDIRVDRTRGLWPCAVLILGEPETGRLKVESHIAYRMAIAAGNLWPESRLPESSSATAILAFLVEWTLGVSMLGGFPAIGVFLDYLLHQPRENPMALIVASAILVTLVTAWRLIGRVSAH